ncbi:MAG: hypothetical protein DYH05_14635 [Acidobacteria bacterium ACB1]|nr:hypothetical protein [Acidobacteriota bacterium]MCE7963706.1 hypothetical protein [Acidobacteria bacterium ACB1]
MTTITEPEFARIVGDIHSDRESIVKHNPHGTEQEILLWMLLSCLISYLSLSEIETPCFNGRPDARMYHDAIHHVLKGRAAHPFDAAKHLALFEPGLEGAAA